MNINSAKIELRKAGWTWNKRNRCWEWRRPGVTKLEPPTVFAYSLRAALRIHRDTVRALKKLKEN